MHMVTSTGEILSKTERPPTITEQTPPASTSSEVMATELQQKDVKTKSKPAEVEGTPKVEETPKRWKPRSRR